MSKNNNIRKVLTLTVSRKGELASVNAHFEENASAEECDIVARLATARLLELIADVNSVPLIIAALEVAEMATLLPAAKVPNGVSVSDL